MKIIFECSSTKGRILSRIRDVTIFIPIDTQRRMLYWFPHIVVCKIVQISEAGKAECGHRYYRAYFIDHCMITSKPDSAEVGRMSVDFL